MLKKVWEGIRCAIEWHKCKSNTIESVIDTKGSTIYRFQIDCMCLC